MTRNYNNIIAFNKMDESFVENQLNYPLIDLWSSSTQKILIAFDDVSKSFSVYH